MQFKFSKYRKVYFIFSGILIAGSIVSLRLFGLKFGIEFTGGSLMEAEFTGDRPSIEVIQNNLSEFNLGEVTLQPVGQKGMLFRMKTIDETTHEKIVSKIQSISPFEEKSFQLIGPAIGVELRQKTELAVILALIAITLYISFAFRKVSRPVSSWQYGIASLIGLFHNILIPLNAFANAGIHVASQDYLRGALSMVRDKLPKWLKAREEGLNPPLYLEVAHAKGAPTVRMYEGRPELKPVAELTHLLNLGQIFQGIR